MIYLLNVSSFEVNGREQQESRMPNPRDCIFGEEIHRIPQEVRIIFGNFVLTHALEEQIDCFQSRLPLTKPERHMLVHLGVPQRMGKMAEDLNTLPSKVTAVADLLEEKKLVQRERDPEDRRAWRLRLTDDGERTRRELMETTVAKFREITGLTETEMEHLAGLMDRIAERILENGFPKGLTL
ncbi:MarR family transcriptional regulator [Tropicimonas sp. TH_r6]|uniref:MarR family winged helix-turn-helix transcriptional regulator n=1 Tax=Tropicimonas sp. TH_r6 TaxID=3082085 RepID=UPI00295420B9|nr:MarR family transcriptional regulator [Tropicimonas sp. TH_r6]MDV7143076.1 MarR family transcriptional regulator [Tropicimonas sp. TH_r6]